MAYQLSGAIQIIAEKMREFIPFLFVLVKK